MLVSALEKTDYQGKARRHLCNLEMGSPPCSAQNLKRKFGYLDVSDRPRNFLTVDELQTLFSRQLQIKQVWDLRVLLSENNVQCQFQYNVDIVRISGGSRISQEGAPTAEGGILFDHFFPENCIKIKKC